MRRTQMKRIISIILCVALLACVSQLFVSVDIMAATRSTDLTSAAAVGATVESGLANLGEDFYAKISYTGYNSLVKNISVETSNDNNVAVYAENSAMNQVWRFIRQSDGSYKIVNISNGLCLSAVAKDGEQYGNIKLADDNGSSSQRWNIYSHESQYRFVPASRTDAALDVDNGDQSSFTDGTNVHLWDNSLSGTRIFSINILFTLADVGNDFYANISYTGYNNTVRYVTAKSTDNNNVALYSYIEKNTSSDQIWHFIRQDDGSYKIINADNGLCLSAVNEEDEQYGNVVVKEDFNDPSQHWNIYLYNSKYIFVPASYLQAALDADNGTEDTFTDGTNVHLWDNSLSGTRIFSINILLTLADVGDVFYAKIGFRNDTQEYGTSVHYELAVDVDRNNDNVIIYQDTANNDHIWLFSKNDDGSYSIKNAYNGKYLNAVGDSDQANVNLSETNDSDSQKWDIYINNNYSSQDNKYAFSPRSSQAKILDVDGNDAANFTNVDLYNFSQYTTGNTAQIFSIDNIETLPKIEPQESEITPVTSDAIKFQLFDYGDYINHADGVAGTDNWRAVSPYFSFVSEDTNFTSTTWAENEPTYDADGFAPNHASVESKLYKNYPVIDLTKNAEGEQKGDGTNKGLDSDARCLGYLFGSEPNIPAVKYYYPKNTILQTYDNKGVNHYYYNSTANVNDSVTTAKANAVDYDYANNEFRIRSYTETGTNYPNWSSFFPFNSTYNTTANTYGNREMETSSIDFWYGMRMDVDFIQSADGKMALNDGTTEEMVFSFVGDDDIWVFIDDVLVLDLGGRHTSVNGSINFATGEVKAAAAVDYSYPTTLKAQFEKAEVQPNGGWDGNTFADYSSHKLSLFYLERAKGMSTCCIDFNMPTPPDNSIEVSKDVVDTNGYSLNSSDKTEYTFRITRSDGTSLTGEELNYTFGTESKTLGSDGIFTLKGGQSVYFTNLSSDTNYKIQEIIDGTAYQNYIASTTVSEDGGEPTTGTSITVKPSEATKTVAFVNTLNSVSVTVQSNIQCTNFENLTKAQQQYYTGKTASTKTTYQITVTNPNGNKLSTLYYRIGEGGAVPVELKNDVGEFTLSNGAKATFTIPAGYSVTVIPKPGANTIERFDYNYSVAITNGGAIGSDQPQTTKLEKVLAYAFTNTYTMQTTPLTINTEISTKFTDGTKPEQGGTVLYRIKGVSGDLLTEDIDLQVAAKCNDDGTVDSITINGLPVGEYTVTQEKAWIWRYTLRTVDSNVTNPTLVGDKLSFTLPKQDGNYLTFNDEITYNKWVDGNSYKQNKFNS